jgi:lipoprotein-releasing system permease protein
MTSLKQMSAEFFIARRYLFSKKNVNFITIISIISIIGVATGVAALIIVLSVFNGFNTRVSSILIGFNPHIRIEAADGKTLEDISDVENKLRDAGVKKFSPYTLNKGLISSENLNKAIVVKGVDENKIGDVSGLKEVLKLGKMDLKNDGMTGGIVIGRILAGEMRSLEGDTVTIISPTGMEKSLTQFVEPKTMKFVVTGIYEADNIEFDSKFAFISIPASQELFDIQDKYNGVEVRFDNIKDSEKEKISIQNLLGDKYKVNTWFDLNADYYSIMTIERWVAFIILSLIIIVACFNILASLTMTVIEKKRDIGILKAMGATEGSIRRIFLFEGLSVGVIGIAAGFILGVGITVLQKTYGLYKLDTKMYSVDALPVELRYSDLMIIPLAALVLCYLASLYPATKAAKENPVSAIRWE